MNTPLVLPPEFDAARLERAREEAASLPECSVDITEERHFSRRFTLEDIARVKARLRSHKLGRSTGVDRKGYKEILLIPNDVLLELFNACLEAYRTIGLECCLLKFLTMLMDGRIREWLDARPDILPRSQNGFRAGSRTNNNTFILRCAAENARPQGRCLYVASVDISNAFPSVNQELLFLKLYKLGMRSPMFD
ncbi:hypothetical protein AURDEDRAFT_62337, partial [Auricularia subglabra TFB-10046 SS5]